jgi:hypothetical protein
MSARVLPLGTVLQVIPPPATGWQSSKRTSALTELTRLKLIVTTVRIPVRTTFTPPVALASILTALAPVRSKACTTTLSLPQCLQSFLAALFSELGHHHFRLQSKQQGLAGVELTIGCTSLHRFTQRKSPVTAGCVSVAKTFEQEWLHAIERCCMRRSFNAAQE